MADIRLGTAKVADQRALRPAKEAAQRRGFSGVFIRIAAAMRFNVLHRRCSDAGFSVSARKSLCIAMRGTFCRMARCAGRPALRRPHPANHRIDAISIALRIR